MLTKRNAHTRIRTHSPVLAAAHEVEAAIVQCLSVDHGGGEAVLAVPVNGNQLIHIAEKGSFLLFGEFAQVYCAQLRGHQTPVRRISYSISEQEKD